MDKSRITIVTLIGALLVIGATISSAIYLSYKQARETETTRALSLARDIVRRSDGTGDQIASGIAELTKARDKAPCSDEILEIFQKIALSSSYLQGIGEVSGDRLICSSFGKHGEGIPLGPVDYVSSKHAVLRTHVEFPFAKGTNFIVLESKVYAGIINKDIVIDVMTEEKDVSLAAFSSDNGIILTQRGVIKPEWIALRRNVKEATFIEGGYMVAMVRSGRYAIGAVAAIPSSHIAEQTRATAMVLVPIGIIAGIGLALGIVQMGRLQLQRQRSVQALEESEAKFRSMFDHAAMGIGIVGLDGRYTQTNPAMQKFLGYSDEELRQKTTTDITYQDDAGSNFDLFDSLRAGKVDGYHLEKRYMTSTGDVRWGRLTASLVRAGDGRPLFSFGMVEDITERKRAEAELKRLNRALQTLSNCNQALVRAASESQLLKDVCEIVVREGGYRMAWVAVGEHDEAKSVRPVAHAGFEDGYLQTVNITWAETERGWAVTGTAIRTGKTVVARNTQADPRLAPWHEEAKKRGYASTIALPILVKGQVFGTLTIHAGDPDAFDSAEVQLLTELSEDLAYGIQALRTKVEHERAEEALRQSEAGLKEALLAAQMGVWNMTLETGRVAWDENLCSLAGRDSSLPAPKYEELSRIYTPASWERLKLAVQNALTAGTPYELDLEMLRPDGDKRWWISRGAPGRDANGRITGLRGTVQDITERKRTEEMQNWLASFPKLSPVLIVEIDRAGGIEFINPAAERVLPNLRQAGLEHPWLTGFQEFEEACQESGTNMFEREVCIGEGCYQQTVHYVPTLHRLRIYGFDITERKQAEEALRASEGRLKEAQRIAHVGSSVWDLATDTTAWSDELYRITGRDPRQHPPRHSERALLYAPESWARLEGAVKRALATGESYELDLDVVRPDGTRRQTYARGIPVRGADGRIILLQGTLQDITELKQVEESLRNEKAFTDSIIESLPDYFFVLDSSGHYNRWNKNAGKALGYTSEELGRTSGLEHVAEDDRPLAATKLQEAITRGSATVEIHLLTKDGKKVPHILTATRATIGGEVYILGVAVDVTERKKLEEQFQQAQKMEAVGRLAGGVAHDFNNLLTIINGYAQMLLERSKSDDPRTFQLQQILEAGERAASLTQQLLAFSRKQVIEPRVLDLNALLKNLEKMLRRLIGEDVQLCTALAPQLGQVKADPAQMEQVIMNLAINARDAMPRGGKLIIGTSNDELDESYAQGHAEVTAGNYVLLAVSDTGSGIDAATLSHIFEPFFTTKGAGKGTGLGLATVHGIVKQAGGHISVYSEVGHGTTFKIYLPRLDRPMETTAEKRPLQVLLSGAETILLVEDEPAVRSLIRNALEPQGYRVLVAAHPEEALSIAEHAGTLHLLLTDVIMPGLSGKELADQLVLSRPELKVLFMSGYTADAIAHHGVLDDGVAFLPKPFTSDRLLRKVRAVLDEQELA